MGIFGKKKIDKADRESVKGESAQLEKVRFELTEKQKEYNDQSNLCVSQQQQLNKLVENCEILREKNKKRRKRAAIICILFIILGVGANVSLNRYAVNNLNNKKILWQREIEEKKAALEHQMNDNPHKEFSIELQ